MACVTGTRQFVAIGLNYADHAAESNLPIPEEPVVFQKWVSCLQGPNDPVTIPKDSKKTDWEVELGVVIGTARFLCLRGRGAEPCRGLLRDQRRFRAPWQTERGATWDKGKGFPTFGPIGPWLVTADEVGDPQNLKHVARRQRRAQAGRQHQDDDLHRRADHRLSLAVHDPEPGDIITTGTPPASASARSPSPGI
jgi:2-keto-4-pentenoate hydratase/2-oxohepta-3-ene-1,7-dioic acid hydratase in catechol pathway